MSEETSPPGPLSPWERGNDIPPDDPADEAFMRLAIEEAEQAAAHGDVPVGAVAVAEGEVLGRRHNCKEALADPTAHAEILLLREVSERLGRWRLPDVTIYCTMEPCAMCAGAMVQARLGRLVYAAPDPRAGAAGSVFDLVRSPALNHRVAVTSGVLAAEARAQLDAFFADLRRRQRDRRLEQEAAAMSPSRTEGEAESGML